MVTREFLLKRGFERNNGCPQSVADYTMEIRPKGGYVSVRFNPQHEDAVGLYAYSETDSGSVRKVVLSDTNVTERDFEIAMEICCL